MQAVTQHECVGARLDSLMFVFPPTAAVKTCWRVNAGVVIRDLSLQTRSTCTKTTDETTETNGSI